MRALALVHAGKHALQHWTLRISEFTHIPYSMQVSLRQDRQLLSTLGEHYGDATTMRAQGELTPSACKAGHDAIDAMLCGRRGPCVSLEDVSDPGTHPPARLSNVLFVFFIGTLFGRVC